MMREISPKERIVFPPFHLDLAAGRLVCGVEAIELPPKAFGLLRYLAERPGQLVSKEELLESLWPDVHVGAGVLKVAIARIRKVLNDPSRRPRFIETAHRRGYRFIAETEAPAPLRDTAEMPKTHSIRSGDVNLASQVMGEGSLDLVFVMGSVSHLDYFWTEPSFARFLRRLGSSSRLMLSDKHGASCPWGPTKEEQERLLDHIRKEWGGPAGLQELACRSGPLPWLLMVISDTRGRPS